MFNPPKLTSGAVLIIKVLAIGGISIVDVAFTGDISRTDIEKTRIRIKCIIEADFTIHFLLQLSVFAH